MTAEEQLKLINFAKEVLSDGDYEGTILKHIFEILNNESISENILNHDLYNLICSMSLKNCEILFRSYDFNLKKIEEILGILSGYRASSIATLTGLNETFIPKLIEDAINIITKITQLYNGTGEEELNNWILLEGIFDILKKYLIEGVDQKNLNIVLNKNLPYRVFVDKNSDFETYYDSTSKEFLPNKIFLISKTDDTYYEVTNFFNIEEKIIIRKTHDETSEIDNYFKFDLKEIIRIFLKDLPIEFVYLNKILNEPEPKASTAVAINGEFYENMKSFFNPGAVLLEGVGEAEESAVPLDDLFPELSNFKSINNILGKGNMYEIFKIILSIKIKSAKELREISYTTLDGDRLCRNTYYNIIKEKIIELKALVKSGSTTPSPTSSSPRPTSSQRKILRKVFSEVTLVAKKAKRKIVSKFYELLIKGILKFLKNHGVDLSDFTKQLNGLTVENLNFETIDKLISILLNNKNLNTLTSIIKAQEKSKIKGKVVGKLCIDYVSYLHYILPIQKNLFKLSLGTNFFAYKFNQILQQCANSVQKYFKYNKMKIDLMEYIITEQDLSNLYDGVELALVYLIIINSRETKPHTKTLNEDLYQKYMEIDSEWTHPPHEQAVDLIRAMFIDDGFINSEIIEGMLDNLTSSLEGSIIEYPAFYSKGKLANEIENSSIKGYKIQLLEGETSIANFFIKNPYWLGSATVTALAAVASTAESCVKLASEVVQNTKKTVLELIGVSGLPFGVGGGKKRSRKHRKNQTRKAKRNCYGKNKSHKRKNKNKRKTKRS